MSSHDSYGHGRGQLRDRETSGTNPDSSPALGRGHGRGRSTSISVYNSGPTQVDPRLSDKSLNELVSSLKRLTTSDRAVRPGFGKKGSSVILRANSFTANYPDNMILYDHALIIEPPVPLQAKELRARLSEVFEQNSDAKKVLDRIAYDHMQRLVAYREPLPPNFKVTIEIIEPGEDNSQPSNIKYVITVKEPKKLSSSDLNEFLQGKNPQYNPLPIISAFNLIITAHARRTGIPAGKSRYYSPLKSSTSPGVIPLSPRLEAWRGFSPSVKPSFRSLILNMNVCTSPFYIPCERVSSIMEKLGPSSVKFLRHVRVTTKYLSYPKKFTIKGFTKEDATKKMFEDKETGGKISVEQYFLRKYNIQLKKKELPVANIGNSRRDIFVPAELLELERGQLYKGPLTKSETTEIIKVSCTSPKAYAEAIAKQGPQLLGLTRGNSLMDKFGMKISTDITSLMGRVLNSPRVSYSATQPRVENGQWSMLGSKLIKISSISRLAILVLSDKGQHDFRSNEEVREVVDKLLDRCRGAGIKISQPFPPLIVQLPKREQNDPLRSSAIEAIKIELGKLPEKPDMVIVFMSGREPRIYPSIKKLFDTKFGIHTVCMLNSRVRRERDQDQYLSNIALKVNARLGGLNHTISTDSHEWLKNSMLVGMDVTHPSAGSPSGLPSIAAVVASCDGSFFQYPVSMRLQENQGQKHCNQMITEVKDMMKERLTEYQNKNKKLPERVIVFRNGISDSQFDIVLEKELVEIKAAFRAFKSYNPKLTIAVCQKRHRTRFFPTREADADGSSNTKAGTVVDAGVTSVYDFDFYLQAHAGTQGTVRATHYTVLFDENKLSADDIQQGLNDISYLWAPATQSVSLVPPAFCADRACERGRAWIHEVYQPPPGSIAFKMDQKQLYQHVKDIWGNGIHNNLRNTMFYL